MSFFQDDEELPCLTRSMSSTSTPSPRPLSPDPVAPAFTRRAYLSYLATLELACARLVTHFQRSETQFTRRAQVFPPVGSVEQIDGASEWVANVRAAFVDERVLGPYFSGKLVEFVWRTRRLGGLVDDVVNALKEMGRDASELRDWLDGVWPDEGAVE